MYFSRVTMVPQELPAHELNNLINGNNYTEHQLLWRLFDGEKREYLFRREQVVEHGIGVRSQQQQALPVFYMVSVEKPKPCTGFYVVSKDYQPQLHQGQQLGFTLRANPVIAKRQEGGQRSQRRDVIAEAVNEAKNQGLEGRAKQQLIDEHSQQWLFNRMTAAGFAVEATALQQEGYCQHRFYKPTNQKRVSMSSLDYSGLLTVTDPVKFQQTLFEGIGKGRAFGCGLMLVRRV